MVHTAYLTHALPRGAILLLPSAVSGGTFLSAPAGVAVPGRQRVGRARHTIAASQSQRGAPRGSARLGSFPVTAPTQTLDQGQNRRP